MNNKFKILENWERYSNSRGTYCRNEKQPYVVIIKWKNNSEVSIDHDWCFDKIFQKNKIGIKNKLIQNYQRYVSITKENKSIPPVLFVDIPNNQVEKFAEEAFDFLSLFFNEDTVEN